MEIIAEILYAELNLISKSCMPNWTSCRIPECRNLECRIRLNAEISNVEIFNAEKTEFSIFYKLCIDVTFIDTFSIVAARLCLYVRKFYRILRIL
jgi:hypothetical protein